MSSDIIFGASIIAAFIAGMVALFAPCCITVLLPAYLGSIFRNKKAILRMTFVFFAGIAVILIPIGLGAAFLAQIFRDFHKEMYLFGGSLMIILAIMSILGRGFSLLPMASKMRSKLKLNNSRSVFLLGIFSGAATSCCAPVLAGAAALAVVSAAFWKALIVVFSYVFGMTLPLFVAAYFYDRFKLEKSRFVQGKLWELKIGNRTLFIHSTNLIAGLIFLLMGATLLVLAFSGNAFWAPSLQVKIGEALNRWSSSLLNMLDKVPDAVWGIVIFGFFFFLVYKLKKSSHQ